MRYDEQGCKNADPRQRAWVEINPVAIEANARSLITRLESNCSFMAVVKADGYGHGSATVARAALLGGAELLGVATLQEGIELRQAGLNCPILILGNLTEIEDLKACIEWQLIPTLSNLKEAFLCENLSDSSGREFPVQVKVDTGMTRLGCDMKDVLLIIKNIIQLRNVKLTGVYSHLALADGQLGGQSSSVTSLQQKRFDDLISECGAWREGFRFHLANSAGTLRSRSLHYDMVRVGLALYGCSPLHSVNNDELGLISALTVRARVTLVRKVPKGVGVSYGHWFTTKRNSRLAVVGIGYADGVNRALSGKISVLFKGKFVSQVGAITMDQLVIDVTDHPDITVGSVVTLLGKDADKRISVQDWSDLSGSIPWEVLCGFKHRLPRLII